MSRPVHIRRLPLVLVAALLALAPGPSRSEPASLVSRDVFFGNPVKAQARISPDGKTLAYLSPSRDDVLNVWVRTLGKSDDRMITKDTKRGIRAYFWAEDGRHLVYLQDVAGNENFHVYAVDVTTDSTRDLTPHEGVRAQNIITDRGHANEILVGLNLRDPKVFDMHRIDLATGESKLDTQNPGDVVGWATDPDFRIRAAIAVNQQDGSTVLRIRDDTGGPWRDLITWPTDDQGTFIDFTPDGNSAYVASSLGSDVTRLLKVDLATGKEVESLATDPRCDVGEVLVEEVTHRVQAVRFEYLRKEWRVLDSSIEGDFKALARVRDGEFSVLSRDQADRTWVVAYVVDDGPVSYYAYDRKSKKATFLFVNQPALEKAGLSKREPVVIEARDGLKLPSYLTTPRGGARKNLGLVLFVHGGPWGRDSWGYDPISQWLASRGYAVLQVNFRASTGLGKRFLHAGDKQWGKRMQDDLTDAVRWAIAKGIADPKRVAIMGGSYGGYATLAGLTFTPDLYACGVDIVGPSNLRTLLASVPPYWTSRRKIFELRMGDVERDSMFNREVSPLFHVDRIRAPLLIGQGQNDPRVNVRESEQIVEAMRAKDLPVEYVVYADEGHGFIRPENRLDFYGRTEEFLAKHLGGRVEPRKDIPGSSAQVK